MEQSRLQFTEWWLQTEFRLRRGGTSLMNTHLKSTTCKPRLQRRGINQLLLQSPQTRSPQSFSEDLLIHHLLQLITIARLLFRILERPKFQQLCDIIQLAPAKIKLPSARSIRRKMKAVPINDETEIEWSDEHEIEMLCDSQNTLQPEEPQGNNDDELNRYLAKGEPLPFHAETSSN
ncbi:hypothetical protein F1880_002013 [Penicillium rolfsii]|nr:hypothetical protein F1880_002013 [Penicillium rolfsii]